MRHSKSTKEMAKEGETEEKEEINNGEFKGREL